MSKEQELLDRWHAERGTYLAWGRKISREVAERLAPIIAPVPASYFLRTPAEPRAKDGQKLIEKAFYRNKPYADPYDDITDKVGTRFVVLLGSDIKKVEQAIESVGGWTLSKDRDYEAEQNENPLKFDYAAVHFIVRPDADTDHDGINIPAGTPCEVQIKTLLQHAYSELTHDTIYKPQIAATPYMQRNAAKAMALLEATNDYFEKVSTDVDAALAAVRQMTSDLSAIYRELIGIEPKPTSLEGLLLGAYENTSPNYLEEVKRLLDEKGFLPGLIRERVAANNPIFKQPSVLLAYLAICSSARRAKAQWPLTEREMEPLLNDLGESVH
ncbi:MULTISPECIES: GTP pyrophosphokinase [Sphingomonas]|uniref:GTP pyrophosphokinase n=1 Tax=Sphingomonas TaxID=13687 RepID=UPI000DEF5E93|nr:MULTISPECIES: RelA/SpoT domain-containing protein [Sphingomonas]